MGGAPLGKDGSFRKEGVYPLRPADAGHLPHLARAKQGRLSFWDFRCIRCIRFQISLQPLMVYRSIAPGPAALWEGGGLGNSLWGGVSAMESVYSKYAYRFNAALFLSRLPCQRRQRLNCQSNLGAGDSAAAAHEFARPSGEFGQGTANPSTTFGGPPPFDKGGWGAPAPVLLLITL